VQRVGFIIRKKRRPFLVIIK